MNICWLLTFTALGEELKFCRTVRDWRELGRWGESLAKLRQTSTHGPHFYNNQIDPNNARIVMESFCSENFHICCYEILQNCQGCLRDKRGGESSAKWGQTTHGPHFCNSDIDPTRTQLLIRNHSSLLKTSFVDTLLWFFVDLLKKKIQYYKCIVWCFITKIIQFSKPIYHQWEVSHSYSHRQLTLVVKM